MSVDNNISCHIKRCDRPCLVCTGFMDLIEARPKTFNLFGGIPLVCTSEGIDCLDCPKCGFNTTTTDYQYLRMCKRDRQGRGMFTNTTTNSHPEQTRSRFSGHRRENSISCSSNLGNTRICSSCQAPLESSSWQFCPACGNRCSSSTSVSPSSRAPNDNDEKSILETIPKTITTTNVVSMSDDDSSNESHNREKQKNSKSVETGIVRMVTPPKRASMNDNYDGSVEMHD